MRILAVANQKGGVGKTTTSINLAALWALRARVLLVDLDPQGNASTGLQVPGEEQDFTITEVFAKQCTLSQATYPAPQDNLFVVPADVGLAPFGASDLTSDSLQRYLGEVKDQYDFAILDCPPSLGHLTINAFAAAHRVLIPLRAGHFSLKGLQQLFHLVENLKDRGINEEVQILGLFYNEAQKRTNLFQTVDRALRQAYGSYLMETTIPTNVRIGEAQLVGEPIHMYDDKARGFEAFVDLAQEVLQRW